jgi:hypothetical protein
MSAYGPKRTCFGGKTTYEGNESAGTDSNRFTLFCRTGLWLSNGMTPAAKCRRLATMLRAKAEQERDPEIRPSGSASHEAILFWLVDLSGMAVGALATPASHEFATSTKKRPDFSSQLVLSFLTGRCGVEMISTTSPVFGSILFAGDAGPSFP